MPKSRQPVYPEPGSWVVDIEPGMPSVGPPAPLPKGKRFTEVDVREFVAYEGLGFCIFSYIPAQRIDNTKLRELWKKARAAMQEVVEHLERTGRPKRLLSLKKKQARHRKAKRAKVGRELVQVDL